MNLSLPIGDKNLFPCPICAEGLEVRKSKKDKPYVICNNCGLQMFVRIEAGIRRFERLIAEAKSQNIWERLAQLAKRYRKKCPECSKKFWITEELRETSWFDGALVGYRCPEPDCDGVAKVEDNQ